MGCITSITIALSLTYCFAGCLQFVAPPGPLLLALHVRLEEVRGWPVPDVQLPYVMYA